MCSYTQHPHACGTDQTSRWAIWKGHRMQSESSFRSDNSSREEEGKKGTRTPTTQLEILSVWDTPQCCIVYLAVYNNDDAAYRELHFAMPLTDHRCEEPFKLLVFERQIRFSLAHAELWKNTFSEQIESSRSTLQEYERVHPRAYYALNLARITKNLYSRKGLKARMTIRRAAWISAC